MTTILIGAPIYQRDWILPDWFRCIENQDIPLNKIGFVFEGSPDDDATEECLLEWHSRHPEVLCFEVAANSVNHHASHPEGRRHWTRNRYHDMVAFRNNLLSKARAYDFERYFSLDTDVLLEDPSTLSQLADYVTEGGAASPLMFMSPNGRTHPSVMSWVGPAGGRATRKKYPLGTRFRADVIMAAKMMSREVYHSVDYKWHPQGEDLGWSAQCAKQGHSLYSLSDIYAPHIMSKKMLREYKDKGDQRNMLKTA